METGQMTDTYLLSCIERMQAPRAALYSVYCDIPTLPELLAEFKKRAEHINMFSFGTFEDDRDGNGAFVNHSGVGFETF